jgi:hypothetical protein
LKSKFPKFLVPISFQQLTLYRAAKSAYFSVLFDDPDEYFIGLMELRRVCLNLSISGSAELYGTVVQVMRERTVPQLPVPFMEIVSSSDFTRSLSQVYLPFIMRMSLQEEVYLSNKALQQRSSRAGGPIVLSDLLRTWTFSWSKSLDRLTGLASVLMWHLTILQEFPNSLEPTVFQSTAQEASQNIKESIRKNHFLLARLLLKAGATTASLRQLAISAQPRDTRQLTVDEQNLPRMMHFLKPNSSPSVYCLKFSVHIALKDFSACQYYSGNLTRQWLPTFLSLLTTSPFFVDHSVCLQRLSREFSGSAPERIQFLMALCIDLVRANRLPVDPFVSVILSSTVKDESKPIFMRWLIHLLKYVKRIPSDVLTSLFKSGPTQFYLFYLHAKSLGMTVLDEFVDQLRTHKELRRYLLDNEDAFRWIAACEEDIRKLNKVVNTHLKLYKLLPTGALDEVQELLKICSVHRPVFRTHANIPSFLNPANLKFPGVSSSVIGINLKADGQNEGILEILSCKGDKRPFLLVSPLLYQFSLDEWLFIRLITKMLENHQSSRCRSHFIWSPLAFLVHPELLLICFSPMTSLFSLIKLNVPAGLIRCRFEEWDVSPKAIRCARKTDEDFLLSYYVRQSEGDKTTFYYLRQSFASHFGAWSCLRFIFRSPLPVLPSLGMFNDGLRVYLPGFFSFTKGTPQVAFVRSILNFLPKFVLLGSFSTSWNTVAHVLWEHRKKLRFILSALRPDVDEAVLTCEEIIETTGRMASQVREEADKVDIPVPFVLLTHLIETAGNSILSTTDALAWI